MKLYMGWGCTLVLYVYVPLALIGLLILFRKIKPWKTRAWAVPLYVLVAYVIPLGDVTWHSWNMAKVCPKAGLHIYRTVVVDGLMTTSGGEAYVQQDGYSFVESAVRPCEYLTTRWEKNSSGVQCIESVIPKSEWELVSSYPVPDCKLGVTVTHDYVWNRMTKEIIAERWRFSAWRGWIDALINSIIDNSSGGCDGESKLLHHYTTQILIPDEDFQK